MGARAREDAADRERGRVLADGVSGLAKVRAGREVDDAERIGLRAIVQQEGRPAIVVRDGDFGEPPALWSQLSGRRDRIREVIARAGRVEVDGHPDHDWVGTAWLVAPATLMTNRHVATKFCRRGRRRSWTFRPGMQSRIDFVRERDSASSLQFEITEAIGVHDDHDLALLRIEGASRDGRPLPDPLAVAASAPRDLLGREVYLVGYPMSDPDRNEPAAIGRIFRDVFDVKRLQPGRTIGYSTARSAVEHDCSTLGGNSGSPLVDLETNLVIGLHFGGTYGVGNYAVPLWMLVDDPLLKAGSIDFR
jgi:endonuclease G, mitochondrial